MFVVQKLFFIFFFISLGCFVIMSAQRKKKKGKLKCLLLFVFERWTERWRENVLFTFKFTVYGWMRRMGRCRKKVLFTFQFTVYRLMVSRVISSGNWGFHFLSAGYCCWCVILYFILYFSTQLLLFFFWCYLNK